MKNIPILLYHHVNRIDKDPTLNVTPDVFEEQMRYLDREGYKTVFLDELIKLKEEKMPVKTVAVTFDDGYLDNWIYAYPVLKKYGIKATIFVTTSNIRNSEKIDSKPCRETHFTINFDCAPEQSNTKRGFMTWKEVCEMERSGLVDIQSHSYSHGYYFVSDKITDFNRLQHWSIPWLTDGDVRLGIPLYERAPSLVAERYYDDHMLRNHLADFVRARPWISLAARVYPNVWRDILSKKSSEFLKSHQQAGYYEDRAAYIKRIESELSLSKKLIEKNLNKQCNYISFPAGKFNEIVVSSAKKIEYIASFANRAVNDNGFVFSRKIISNKPENLLKHLNYN